MNEIADYWAPNSETGFIAKRAPSSVSELTSSSCEFSSLLGEYSHSFGTMSDVELAAFARDLPPPSTESSSLTRPKMYEGLLRALVSAAVHFIHRPGLKEMKRVPHSIAVPMFRYSELVGRPPSLTYSSYVLANYEGVILPKSRAEDLKIAQTPSCTKDEEWFVAVHLAIESAGGGVYDAISKIESGIKANDAALIVYGLGEVKSTMEFACQIMPTIFKRLSKDVFLERVRFLLYGHGEVELEGVNGGQKFSYVGETGAQSGVIKAVSTILGVKHNKEVRGDLRGFLNCAPPLHQKYFGETELLSDRLVALSDNAEVSNARKEALGELSRFRKLHLKVVSEYLSVSNPNSIGTGGTVFSKWLNKLISDTDREI